MSKLEDMPRKSFFEVPESYFEKLPSRIQSRISDAKNAPVARPLWQYGLQYALPLLVTALILFYNYSPAPDAESILASVETTDLVRYLQQETALTTEEVLDNVEFMPADVSTIENEVYDLQIEDTADRDIELELNTL